MSSKINTTTSHKVALAMLRSHFSEVGSDLPLLSTAEFMALLRYASWHGILPALAEGLRRTPLLNPPWSNLVSFLDIIESDNAKRNVILKKVALSVADCL